MKILVTGGQGFLGRRVLELLLEEGHQVKALVRREAQDLAALGAEIVRGDLLAPETLISATKGVDGVIHCAARSGIWGPLDDYIQANTVTTWHILNAARRAGAAWLVHTSSPSVVHTGRPLEGVDESAPYTNSPRQAYPYSKMLAEKLVMAADEPTFRTAALRPHLIWGPGDPHFLPRLTAKARSGRLCLIRSQALVDGTYIDNAAQAHLLAARKLAGPQAAEVGGRAFFIGQGQPLTAAAMISNLLAAVSRESEPLSVRRYIPAWLGLAAGTAIETVWPWLGLKSEPPLTRFVAEELALPHWFNLTLAQKLLGYTPAISLEEGLHRLKQWAMAASGLPSKVNL